MTNNEFDKIEPRQTQSEAQNEWKQRGRREESRWAVSIAVDHADTVVILIIFDTRHEREKRGEKVLGRERQIQVEARTV